MRRSAGAEVDGDAPVVHVQAAVLDGRADALARFLDGGIGQAHDEERRQAAPRVHFHFHDLGVQSDDGAGVDFGEHNLGIVDR